MKESTEKLDKFYEEHCRCCGSQRCLGVHDEECREGCELYKKEFCNEEELFEDLDKEIKEVINFNLLTDEQRIKALELAMSGYLASTKYIHEVTGMSLKCSKTYYDLYIRPSLI